jgi:hypothetical protein
MKSLPMPKSPVNLTFSNENSDSDEDHGQQEMENIDCDPTFEASYSSSEPHSLLQEDISNLVRDLNFFKRTEPLGSKLRG